MATIWQRYDPARQAGTWAAALALSAVVAAIVASIAALQYNKMLSVHARWQALPSVMWHTLGYRWMALPFAVAFTSTLLLIFAAMMALTKQRESLYGDARFATSQEIRRAGLRRGVGTIIGIAAGGVVRVSPEKHIYFAAPTRSGKGVGFVIPNLLDYEGSAVVLDGKREAYHATSGWRRRMLGQKCYLIDPFNIDGETSCFNPLGYIDRADPIGVVTELQRIALQLLPYPTTGNPFFTDAARNGFVGVGAYLAASPNYDLTLSNILAMLTNDPQRRLGAAVEEIGANPSIKIAAGAVQLLASFVKIPAETFGSVKATIESKLGLFGNPRVVMATSRSDFDLRELRTTPFTVYLGADLDDLTILAPLYNLIFQQVSSLCTRQVPPRPASWRERRSRALKIRWEARQGDQAARQAAARRGAVMAKTGFEPGQRNAVRVLIILDEFKRVGKMDVLAEAFSYLSGFGVQIAAVFQSPSQVVGVYGQHMAREIEANCGVHIFFTPNERVDAEDLSKRLGTKTVKTRSRSDTRPSVMGAAAGSAGSFNHSEASRALMMPDEVLLMPKSLGVVFMPGETRPFIIKRIRHFAMKPWLQRSTYGWVRPPVQDVGKYNTYMERQGAQLLEHPDAIAAAPLDLLACDAELRAEVMAIVNSTKAAATGAPVTAAE